ncbi:MAG: endonuclease [Bacteroidales bacterium]
MSRFYDESVPTWVSPNRESWGSCSAAGYTVVVFEPRDEFKGNLARNYFYMATRYESRLASWQPLDPYGDAVMNWTRR